MKQKLFNLIFINYFTNKWNKIYPKFDKTNYSLFELKVPNSSSFFHGEIIKWAKDNSNKNSKILFAGENNEIKKVLGFNQNIFTTSLENSDYIWNFEENYPPSLEEKRFDLIISQAILEHLINPYKHVLDLSRLLNKKGVLILHTVIPLFPYHRYPIDCFRFFPDWFEEIAKRFNLKILNKKIKGTHIFYMYQK